MASAPGACDKLINTALEIQNTPVRDAGEIGYTTPLMALASLPHSDQKTGRYERRNGNLRMIISDPREVGIPYGVIPRLILIWIITNAIRTKSKTLILGESLYQFLKKLNITPSGGHLGSTTRVTDQMNRLFSSVLTFEYVDGQGHVLNVLNAPVAHKFKLWISKDSNQGDLWNSEITLTDEFYKEIIKHKFPIDMRILRALKQSPMAIDIYLWRTYLNGKDKRKVKKPVYISIEKVQLQFGAGYAFTPRGRKDFKQAFKRALRHVNTVYPGVNIELIRGRIILLPGEPSVPKLSSGIG